MKIQLEHWTVSDLQFKIKDQPNEADKNSFNLRTSQTFYEKESHQFHVIFNITIDDSEFDLTIEASFQFRTQNEITEEFKVSDFPRINAPAIAFPFLRAYISNLTLQSGFQPVILPSINFLQVAKEKQ